MFKRAFDYVRHSPWVILGVLSFIATCIVVGALCLPLPPYTSDFRLELEGYYHVSGIGIDRTEYYVSGQHVVVTLSNDTPNSKSPKIIDDINNLIQISFADKMVQAFNDNLYYAKRISRNVLSVHDKESSYLYEATYYSDGVFKLQRYTFEAGRKIENICVIKLEK